MRHERANHARDAGGEVVEGKTELVASPLNRLVSLEVVAVGGGLDELVEAGSDQQTLEEGRALLFAVARVDGEIVMSV